MVSTSMHQPLASIGASGGPAVASFSRANVTAASWRRHTSQRHELQLYGTRVCWAPLSRFHVQTNQRSSSTGECWHAATCRGTTGRGVKGHRPCSELYSVDSFEPAECFQCFVPLPGSPRIFSRSYARRRPKPKSPPGRTVTYPCTDERRARPWVRRFPTAPIRLRTRQRSGAG